MSSVASGHTSPPGPPPLGAQVAPPVAPYLGVLGNCWSSHVAHRVRAVSADVSWSNSRKRRQGFRTTLLARSVRPSP